jgi:hypothetical protein
VDLRNSDVISGERDAPSASRLSQSEADTGGLMTATITGLANIAGGTR